MTSSDEMSFTERNLKKPKERKNNRQNQRYQNCSKYCFGNIHITPLCSSDNFYSVYLTPNSLLF